MPIHSGYFNLTRFFIKKKKKLIQGSPFLLKIATLRYLRFIFLEVETITIDHFINNIYLIQTSFKLIATSSFSFFFFSFPNLNTSKFFFHFKILFIFFFFRKVAISSLIFHTHLKNILGVKIL